METAIDIDDEIKINQTKNLSPVFSKIKWAISIVGIIYSVSQISEIHLSLISIPCFLFPAPS